MSCHLHPSLICIGSLPIMHCFQSQAMVLCTCLAQVQSLSQNADIKCVQARIPALAAELAQDATTPACWSTHPVDLIQGLPASGLAHLVTKLQIVQTPHILLKV